MKQFNTSQSIGDIVALLPKAGEVFKEFRIDFCCGGNRPLAAAIGEQQLNEDEVLDKLEKAYLETGKLTDNKNFINMKSSELIDYIVATHHVFVKAVLPEIGELAAKILRVHGAHHEELFRVHKLFNNLRTELEQHLIKEEELLFPLIKEYEAGSSEELLNRIDKVMNETENEHEGAGDILKELRKITNEYEVPADGCRAYELTYIKLQELESDLFQHIHLENNILFKRYDKKVILI